MYRSYRTLSRIGQYFRRDIDRSYRHDRMRQAFSLSDGIGAIVQCQHINRHSKRAVCVLVTPNSGSYGAPQGSDHALTRQTGEIKRIGYSVRLDSQTTSKQIESTISAMGGPAVCGTAGVLAEPSIMHAALPPHGPLGGNAGHRLRQRTEIATCSGQQSQQLHGGLGALLDAPGLRGVDGTDS